MSKEQILAAARDRMREAREAEDEHIDRAVSDLRFLTGEDQWPEEERRIREAEGKPTLVLNTLPQFVRRICGQIRQMNPAIKVSPSDDAASEDVAEIYEGIVREIEYRCNASSIYEGAAESAAQCGIGNFRILADYCDDTSFDQHVSIERLFNPFSVFYDPAAKHPTREDAEWCFVVDHMREEAFKAEYPKAALSSVPDTDIPTWWRDWRAGKTVVVADYYWKEYDKVELFLLPGGQVVQGPLPKGVDFQRKRTANKTRIMWAKVSGDDVLDGPQRVAGEYLPVIAVTGEELHIGEEVYRSGVVRHAKDAVRIRNIMRTASVESALLQPRAPFVGTMKQFEGLEDRWEQANHANYAYLPYNPDEQAPGPPQRLTPPIASQALSVEAQVAADDIKATIGMYDASLGARSNETSGVAIDARQREAEMSTSVYADNMVKAISHAGRVIVSMIPEIYDAERMVRILGEDAQEKIVAINKRTMAVNPLGELVPMVENDMKAGRYAVRIAVGPAYSTRKQESADGMLSFMEKIPNAAPVIADLVAGAQDWPDAERISQRMRKMVPPDLLEEDEKEPDPQVEAQKQQQAEAMMAQAQQQKIKEEAEVRKAVAEAEEAIAKANLAKLKVEEMKAARAVQLNVGQVAPVPVMG